MASHGRRYASNKTKLAKAYKKQRKTANLKLKQLNKSKYHNGNPAMKHILGSTHTKSLPKASGMNVNNLRRYMSKATKFNHSETSTPKGAKKVLRKTFGNIFKGQGGATEQDVQMYNNFDVLISNLETGVDFIQNYFDIFYKIKDQLSSMKIANVPSDEVLDAIKQEVYSGSVIKDTSAKLHERDLSDGDVQEIMDTYADVMSSKDFIDDVVARLS